MFGIFFVRFRSYYAWKKCLAWSATITLNVTEKFNVNVNDTVFLVNCLCILIKSLFCHKSLSAKIVKHLATAYNITIIVFEVLYMEKVFGNSSRQCTLRNFFSTKFIKKFNEKVAKLWKRQRRNVHCFVSSSRFFYHMWQRDERVHYSMAFSLQFSVIFHLHCMNFMWFLL